MPYMSVAILDGNNKITIRLHGTFNNYVANPTKLRECATVLWDQLMGNNVPEKVQLLADQLSTMYVDDRNIMYVNVEYETKANNNIFGASSDKVLV